MIGDIRADGEALASLRRRTREFLERHARPRTIESLTAVKHPDEAMRRARRFQGLLAESGLAALRFPTAYGGQGLGPAEQFAVNEECRPFEIPTKPLDVALGQVGSALLGFGTHEQKLRHLPAIARASQLYCQLWSEPDAGSDLPALRTRGVVDGDRAIVTGHKVWSSYATWANWGLLLARTEPESTRTAGLTMFLIDMSSPGIEVRPLRQMTGDSTFCEVYLDEVVVPMSSMVGSRGAGWRVATETLISERLTTATSPSQGIDVPYTDLVELARRTGALADRGVRRRLVDVWVRERVVRLLNGRVLAASADRAEPGPEGSILKLAGSRLANASATAAVAIAGAPAIAWEADDESRIWAHHLLQAPSRRISGGTDEVQRNTIGERVLGLPRARWSTSIDPPQPTEQR